MASIEERLTALAQEHAALKKSDELQTIALRALVTKDAFEALREANHKIFQESEQTPENLPIFWFFSQARWYLTSVEYALTLSSLWVCPLLFLLPD